jgi:hypothetical protein
VGRRAGHRDIKPANLLVRDGRLLLIDVAFVEARPSPWRQAVDLANMMLCLALRSDPRLVYQRALQYFTVEEISEGFAAARGLALPSQLRHLLREKGRDLHAEFVRLPQPIRIQRWSARRIGLWAAILALLVLAALNQRHLFDNQDAVQTPLMIKDVGCGDLEPLWLMAQSVQSASRVPCVQFLPVGWSVAEVAVNNGRSLITLNNDRAGAAALVVRLTASCDPSGGVEGPSATAGVRHFQGIESRTGEFAATWYDQFPGGCVTSRLHLTTDPTGSSPPRPHRCWASPAARRSSRRSANAPTDDSSSTQSSHDEPARPGEIPGAAAGSGPAGARPSCWGAGQLGDRR